LLKLSAGSDVKRYPDWARSALLRVLRDPSAAGAVSLSDMRRARQRLSDALHALRLRISGRCFVAIWKSRIYIPLDAPRQNLTKTTSSSADSMSATSVDEGFNCAHARIIREGMLAKIGARPQRHLKCSAAAAWPSRCHRSMVMTRCTTPGLSKVEAGSLWTALLGIWPFGSEAKNRRIPVTLRRNGAFPKRA